MLARLWFHFLFAWLALVLPFLTWRRRAAYRRGAPAVKLDTRQLHARVIFGQWLAVLGLLLVCGRVGIPFAALGLTMPKLVPLAIAAAILAALGAWWVRTQERALANPDKVAKMRERFGGFLLLVPLTEAEQRSWILLSITAGVCEEVLYRGFMGFYLGQWMTLSTAA